MNIPETVMQEGVEFRVDWQFLNDDDTPKDLTGYSVLVQIREADWFDDFILSYDEDSPEITLDPVNGEVGLLIPAEGTRDLEFCTAHIDCYVTNEVDGDRTPELIVVFDRGVSRGI